MLPLKGQVHEQKEYEHGSGFKIWKHGYREKEIRWTRKWQFKPLRVVIRKFVLLNDFRARNTAISLNDLAGLCLKASCVLLVFLDRHSPAQFHFSQS